MMASEIDAVNLLSTMLRAFPRDGSFSVCLLV